MLRIYFPTAAAYACAKGLTRSCPRLRTLAKPMLMPCRFPKMISSFRCFTVCVPTYSAASSGTAIASASTSLSARTGSLTSCAASPSVPPTSASSCATFSADKIAQRLQLLADGDAVTQRDQNGIELLRSIDQPVEFLNALSIRVIGCGRPRRFAGPKRIIRDKQAPAPQLRQRRVQSVWVLMLVHVVENQIECARRFLEQLLRNSHVNVDPLGHARAPKIIPCPPGFFRVAVRVNHLTLRPCRPRQPDCGVTDCLAHLKHSLRSRHLHEKRQHAGHGQPDDGDVVLCRMLFHLSDDFIPRRQQLVQVIVNVILHECTAQIVGSNHSVSPGFSA